PRGRDRRAARLRARGALLRGPDRCADHRGHDLAEAARLDRRGPHRPGARVPRVAAARRMGDPLRVRGYPVAAAGDPRGGHRGGNGGGLQVLARDRRPAGRPTRRAGQARGHPDAGAPARGPPRGTGHAARSAATGPDRGRAVRAGAAAAGPGSAVVFIAILFAMLFWAGTKPSLLVLVASPAIGLILAFST